MITPKALHYPCIAIVCLTTEIGLMSCEKQKNNTPKPTQSSETQSTQKAPASVTTTEPISFNEHIQPILSAACYHCHGPDAGSREPGGPIAKNGGKPLRIDLAEYAFEKRENGKAVIIPGDPDNSLLLQLMESQDPNEVMPLHPSRSPHGSILEPEKIALVRRWIKEGAQYEVHWAYVPPKKHPLPEVQHTEWAKDNPIDRFVAARFEKKGLTPNPQEKPARLYRRLYLDLTGLPPTLEELKRWLNDPRDPDTVYLEAVNHLLHSQAYAEHWTRHWLDVARYADTHGYHLDNYRSIWPYRDWVLNAFKTNMPFDEFTLEQIAGDMIPNATRNQIIATGFSRCLPTNGESGSIPEEYNVIYAQDRVDTTSATWLGLTTGCAACHDHKFDAISTKENYQLTAFFRNTPMTALDKHAEDHPPNVRIMTEADELQSQNMTRQINKLEKTLKAHKKANEKNFQQWYEQARQQQPNSEKSKDKIHKLLQVKSPNKKQIQQIQEHYFQVIDPKSIAFHKQLKPLKEQLKKIHDRSPITLVMKENADKKPFAHVLERGSYTERREKVTPETPAVLPPMGELPRNRLGLAKWLTMPENPLPARVSVNRYWHYIFGKGIVTTTGDFGVMGARPTHPKLLDWLAKDFVDNKWDIHHLLRTIVTSATYRQSAHISETKRIEDPQNAWLSRAPRYRLDGEQIRDLALHTSGLLHTKFGGPPVKPYQPKGIWEAISMKQSNTKTYKADSGNKLYRRSIYTFWKRTASPASMEIFDAPVRMTTCVKREITNTPLQALVIMNDTQFVEASRNLAQRAMLNTKKPEDTINYMAKLLLSRPMRNTEIQVIHNTYKSALIEFTSATGEAKKLINTGNSIPDPNLPAPELAAWTIVANQILNMDETLNK